METDLLLTPLFLLIFAASPSKATFDELDASPLLLLPPPTLTPQRLETSPLATVILARFRPVDM